MLIPLPPPAKDLPTKVVNASLTIMAQTAPGFKTRKMLEQMLQEVDDPFIDLTKVKYETPTRLWEYTDWGDGREHTVRTIATFNEFSDTHIEQAQLLLTLLRGCEQHQRSNQHSKIRHFFQLDLEVKNTVNSAVAWLDCETGKLHRGKAWPEAPQAGEKSAVGSEPSTPAVS